MADLTPRIGELVGRLASGRADETARSASGSALTLRPGDAGFAEAVVCLLAMPLDQYARDGAQLEVQVPWHGETLSFVPDDRQAEALVREGVSRGRIWTAEELLRVMTLASGGVVRTISLAKVTMDGHIVEVSARDRGAPDGRGRRQRLP